MKKKSCIILERIKSISHFLPISKYGGLIKSELDLQGRQKNIININYEEILQSFEYSMFDNFYHWMSVPHHYNSR